MDQVLALQQGLYGKQLLPRLERLVSEDADFAQLGAVHHTAETHSLVELARSDHGTGPSEHPVDTIESQLWQMGIPPMFVCIFKHFKMTQD